MKFGARSSDSLTDFDQAKAKQAQLPASRVLTPPIPTQRWIRNSRHPNAVLESMKGEAANVAGMLRTKEVFRTAGILDSVNTSTRWRHAWHSGPYTSFLCVRVIGRSVPSTTVAAATRLDLTDVAGNVLQTVTFTWGPNGDFIGGWSFNPESLIFSTKYLEINPDTDYYAVWTDVSNGAIQSACCHEISSLTENFDGYIPQNFAVTGPLLDAYRRNLAEFTRAMWRRGGAHVLNWTVNDGTTPLTTSSFTNVNIFDSSATPVWGPVGSPSTAGFILDMTGKARRSQTSGVPVVMKVFGKLSAGAGITGNFYLVDASNNVVMSIINGWTTSAGWASTTGYLPAGVGKYDPQFVQTGGATLSLYAISIYEYEA